MKFPFQSPDVTMPPPQDNSQVGSVLLPEAEYNLAIAKNKLKNARNASKPTTKFGLPAHKKDCCQNCPDRVDEKLMVNSDGSIAQACAKHQYLYDNIKVAHTEVKKWEGIHKRLKSGASVPRSELATKRFTEADLTADERKTIHDLGYVKKEVILQAIYKAFLDMGFEETEL